MSWSSRTKDDLIIEVWERLDCESVGTAEIEAIMTVVGERFGVAAVDSPMVVARLLADEGAELRHAEVMKLYVDWASERPYDAALRGLLKLDDLARSLESIRRAENLRRKYAVDKDTEGVRLLRRAVIAGKNEAVKRARSRSAEAVDRQIADEIADWLTIWLQTPEVFEDWVALRRESRPFVEKFGRLRN